MEQLVSLRERYQSEQESSTLTSLLTRCRSSKSSLAVDKIYALLSLSPEYAELGRKNDDSRYTRSVTDTYQMFTRRLIETEFSLDYICLAGEEDRADDLPSWVPDLRASRFPEPLFVKNELECDVVPKNDH